MIRKWIKSLVDYCFSDYLLELRQINQKLSIIAAERNTKGMVLKVPSELRTEFANIKPLERIGRNRGSIFNAE